MAKYDGPISIVIKDRYKLTGYMTAVFALGIISQRVESVFHLLILFCWVVVVGYCLQNHVYKLLRGAISFGMNQSAK